MSDKTKPDVFIIESLSLSDEKDDRLEGRRLASMLQMSRKEFQYFYVRTEQELKEILQVFTKSDYRYLHVSCHGCKQGIRTTFDTLDLNTFSDMLKPHINQRRVFLSACEVTTMSLAARLMMATTCYSVMGPYNKIEFDRAALFWASFYHLMFRENPNVMNSDTIRQQGNAAARLFKVRIKLFTKNGGSIRPEVLR